MKLLVYQIPRTTCRTLLMKLDWMMEFRMLATTEPIRRQRRSKEAVLLETEKRRRQRVNLDRLRSQTLGAASDGRFSGYHASEEHIANMVKWLMKENHWRKNED